LSATDNDQSNSAEGFLSLTAGIPLISDAEWYQSRCANQAAVAVRPATSVIPFPSREAFPLAQARLAPTTTQQQPSVVREGKDTTLVAKVTVDRATILGAKVMVDRDTILGAKVMVDRDTILEVRKTVDKAIIQEDRGTEDRAITRGVKEMVDKAITQVDKEMVDRDTTQEDKEEEDRDIIQEDRGTSQALEVRGITQGYQDPGLDSTRTSSQRRLIKRRSWGCNTKRLFNMAAIL